MRVALFGHLGFLLGGHPRLKVGKPRLFFILCASVWYWAILRRHDDAPDRLKLTSRGFADLPPVNVSIRHLLN